MMNAWSILPFPTQAGQVGGHEGVGKIVKMGPGTDNAAVKIGDRVGIKWMAGICEACEACRAGMDANCFSGVRPIFPLYLSPFPPFPERSSLEKPQTAC
jgi:propanol-preferring alcohol dehydrogenase